MRPIVDVIADQGDASTALNRVIKILPVRSRERHPQVKSMVTNKKKNVLEANHDVAEDAVNRRVIVSPMENINPAKKVEMAINRQRADVALADDHANQKLIPVMRMTNVHQRQTVIEKRAAKKMALSQRVRVAKHHAAAAGAVGRVVAAAVSHVVAVAAAAPPLVGAQAAAGTVAALHVGAAAAARAEAIAMDAGARAIVRATVVAAAVAAVVVVPPRTTAAVATTVATELLRSSQCESLR